MAVAAAKPVWDLAIIGAGPAGLLAATTSLRLGHKVALIERHKLGGNSCNTGSVPSKALIRSAGVFETMRDAHEFGVADANPPAPDFSAVMARLHRIRAHIAASHSAERLHAIGINLIRGDARFTSPGTITVGDATLAFRKALIATGASPRQSNVPGLDRIGYQTSDSIFDMQRLPKRLAIIGGGPVGCELAQAFCRLGASVIIAQDEPKFLPLEERDAAELLSRCMARDGVDIRLNTTVTAARIENGTKILDAITDGVKSTIAADEILLSIGRVPNVAGIGLDAASIAYSPDTGVQVDDYLRTTNSNVYAAGDVCTTRHFANVAEASATLAVQNAFGRRTRRQSVLKVPWCTFCDPEIAHIGMQVRQARAQQVPVKTYTVMMQDVDRAITDSQEAGFVKIHIREGTDTILGATIVAPRASDMINEISIAMSAGIGLRALAKVPHVYPAQSEAIRMAAVAYVLGREDRTPGAPLENKDSGLVQHRDL